MGWRYRDKPQPKNTKFKIPSVDAPNVQGPRDLGFDVGMGAGPADVSALKSAVDAGGVKVLYVFDPGPDGSIGETDWIVAARAAGKITTLIVQAALKTPLADAADILLAGSAFVEKDATYTNMTGHVQALVAGDSAARRCRRRLADSRQARRRLRHERRYASATALREGIANALADLPNYAALAGHHVLAARVGAQLAAGLESVGAVEVGFHVPGSAARQVRRGLWSAAAGGSHSASQGRVTPRVVAVRAVRAVRTSGRAVLIAVALWTAAASLVGQSAPPSAAQLTPTLAASGVHPGETIRGAIAVHLPEGYHAQSNAPKNPAVIPTRLTFEPGDGISATEVVFPKTTDIRVVGFDELQPVFERDFVIGVAFKVDPTTAVGPHNLTVHLRYQACNDRQCLVPASVHDTWVIPVVAAGTAVTPTASDALNGIAFGHGAAAAGTDDG